MEAELWDVAEEVGEGPADWFVAGEGVVLDVEADADEDDEEDAEVDVAGVEPLAEGGLGLGEGEEGADAGGGGALPAALGSGCCFGSNGRLSCSW